MAHLKLVQYSFKQGCSRVQALHADVVKADRAINVETSAVIIGELLEVGRSFTLILRGERDKLDKTGLRERSKRE